MASDFDNPKLRPFLSIRWKLFLALAGLIFLIHTALALGFWKVQKNIIIDNNIQVSNFVHSHALALDIGALAKRMSQNLKVITSSNERQLAEIDGLFSSPISAYSDRLIVNQLIDYIAFYTPAGELISQKRKRSLVRHRVLNKRLLRRLSKGSKTISGLSCQVSCFLYVISPLVVQGETLALSVAQQSISQLLINFSYTHDIQVGLLKDLAVNADYKSWDEQVFNLTKSHLIIPLLVQLQRDQGPINIEEIYPLSANDSQYLISFDDYVVSNKSLAKWVFIKDVTEETDQFNVAMRSNFVYVTLSLFISLLLLYLLIERISHQLLRILAVYEAIGRDDDPFSLIEVKPNSRVLDDELQQYDRHLAKLSHKMTALRRSEVLNADKLQALMSELNQAKSFIDRLLNDEQTIILMQKLGGEIIALNEPGCKLFEIDNFYGKTYAEIFCSDLLEENGLAALNYLYLGGQTLVKTEVHWRNSKADLFILLWVHTLLSVPDAQEPVILSICVDITEQRKAEARLELLAFKDPSLISENKQVFLEYLPIAVNKSLEQHQTLALLFCEISGLTHYASTTDTSLNTQLVLWLNQKMTSCLRESDKLVQMSDEHFVIILEGLNNRSAAEVVIDKIIAIYAAVIEVNNQEFTLDITIGASYAPEDTNSVPQLLKIAEHSMFKAKRKGLSYYARVSE